MSEFNKDDYLNDLPDADNLSATGQAGPSDGAAAGSAGKASDSAKSADASADKELPARLGTRRPPKRALPIRLVTPLPRVRMTERPPTTR